ncbi:hypothetical protein [Streptomyces sp. NPDC001450]
MTDPVYRTILLFDIERFGARDDVEQAFLRRILYDVVDATLMAAGVDETATLRADRGDSVMELIDAQVSVPTLVKTLLAETPARLHSKNRLLAHSARMRLRIVLSSGYVAVDELDGWVGSDLNHAVRLLDADSVRDALRQREDDCVLCVSDSVYQGVVRHGPVGVRPDDFHRTTIATKEGPTVAWLHGTPAPAAPATPDVPPTSPDAAGAPSGPAAGTASSSHTSISGDQYGVTGGIVHGGVRFDLPGRGERR